MVQTDRRLGALAVASLCLTGAWMAAGCSDAPSREEGRALLAQTREAQRLYDRAIAILSNVGYKVAGEESPIFRLVSEKPEELLPAGRLNPKALRTIEKARGILTKALADNTDAPRADQSLAHEVLSKVWTLEATCRSFEARAARQQAANETEAIRGSLGRIRRQLALLAYLDKLAALKTDDIQQMLSKATQKLAVLTRDVKRKSDQIDEKKVLRDAMLKGIQTHNAKARALRGKSDVARGDTSLDLFDEAQTEQRKAAKLLGDVRQIEHEMESLKTDISDLRIEEETIRRRQAIAKDILSESQAGARKAAKVRGEIAVELKQAVEQTDQQLASLAGSCRTLSNAERKAVSDYAEAGKLAKRARLGASGDEGLFAGEAAALTAASAVRAHSLVTRRKNEQLLDELTVLWAKQNRELPEAVERIRQYVPKADEVLAAALKGYQAAADLYKKAERAADAKHRWIYQTHLGAVHYQLGTLQNNPEELGKAQAIVKKALAGDKKDSPYLRPTVRLQGLIDQAMQ